MRYANKREPWHYMCYARISDRADKSRNSPCKYGTLKTYEHHDICFNAEQSIQNIEVHKGEFQKKEKVLDNLL